MMDSVCTGSEQFKAQEPRWVRRSVQNAASHAARFSFMPFGHEVTGLKTYRGPKRKERLGVRSIPGLAFTNNYAELVPVV
jgi:hypothetical protein